MRTRSLPHFLTPLFLSAGLWLASPALSAQEHGPKPEIQQTESDSGHAAEASKADSHGKAQEHHGPEITLFGHTLGKGAQFGIKLLNFAIFAGILYFLLKGTLSALFKLRAKELEEKLAAAEREKAEAEAQIRGLEARMTEMQAELDGILARAESDAESEKQRILAVARAEAGQILSQAQQEIDFQRRAAEQELRALVTNLAVEGAMKRLQIQVQGPMADQVMDKAIQRVGGAK